MKKQVPSTVIRRLPRYHRYLGDLIKAGYVRISSRELSEKMRVTASQIRQDFNCFGGFGQQGYGYNVNALFKEISSILAVDMHYKAILVGYGNLGNAIANNVNFDKRGIELAGIFDINDNVIGTKIRDIEVMHMDEITNFIEINQPKIAILTLPKSEAKAVFDLLVKMGIKGFWNFSNMEINPPEGISIENMHLGDSLMTLCYKIKNDLQ